MERGTQKALETLLKKGRLKTPSSDLTDKIMQKIDVEASRATTLEPELKKLIKLHTLKTPPPYLTRRIESQLFPKTQKHPPLISVRIWYTMTLGVVILLVSGYYAFPSGTSSQQYKMNYWTSSLYKLSNLTSSIPEEYLAGLMTVFTLLTIDFFWKYKTGLKLAKS